MVSQPISQSVRTVLRLVPATVVEELEVESPSKSLQIEAYRKQYQDKLKA